MFKFIMQENFVLFSFGRCKCSSCMIQAHFTPFMAVYWFTQSCQHFFYTWDNQTTMAPDKTAASTTMPKGKYTESLTFSTPNGIYANYGKLGMPSSQLPYMPVYLI